MPVTLILILAAVLQEAAAVPVTVRHDDAPVAGATVTCGPVRVQTDAAGRASVPVPAGGCTLVVTRDGLSPFSHPLLPSSPPLIVDLEAALEVEEEVVVATTRSGRLASDQARRVEVVTREEIEEKLLMTPGDIAMLLNETGGIRLQPTSPALGAASVRVQGLPGRFTAVLTDGLPINGTQVASLGLLQIPPMDLQQVEVIKGAASALYGPSALGGVINLVTRRPTETHGGEALLNVTSRSGADAVLWASGPAGPSWGYTMLTGLHSQNAVDVDRDGWADLPRYRRLVARPKLAWASSAGSLDISGGLTLEHRRGGLLAQPVGREAVDTTRVDAGAVWRGPVGSGVFVGRGAVSFLKHDHEYGVQAYDDRHESASAEVSMNWSRGAHTFVVGGGLDRQRYRNPSLPRFDYTWTTPAVFVQDDVTLSERATMSVSGRVDVHPDFGVLWSPRVSLRVRPGDWDVRLSAGRGAFAPTVFVDEVDEVGLTRVGAVRIERAETAETWSVDVSRALGPIEVSGTWFGSRIHDPVAAWVVADEGVRLDVGHRASGAPTRIWGAEVFGRLRRGPWVATATHAWVRATDASDDEPSRREDVPLTPRRTFGLVAAWEQHGKARVGVEVYYTGTQRLEDNPYRANSAPYTLIGLLAERRIGRMRVFINLENLTDVRQSSFDPLLRPSPSILGRLVVSAWAPLEGRTINGGVRVGF